MSKKLMQKQSALAGLIEMMKGMDLEHVKGFKDRKSKKPDMEATMETMDYEENEEEDED